MSVRPTQVVRVPVQPFFVAKAVIASLWKSGFMGDTFVRNRTAFEKYQRSVVGDLAKLCLKSWLETQALDVIDWDDVRPSWRSQRKKFDIQSNGHDIEVRSSISQYPNVADTLANENILHPANIRVKEVTVQVFFADSDCREAWLFGWAERDHLQDPALRSPRRVGPRLVDFYLMPFDHAHARPMRELVTYLRR